VTVHLVATRGLLLRLAGSGAAATATLDLVFTTLNWATPQLVEVFAAADTQVEGTHTGTITATLSGGDTWSGAVTGGTGRADEFVVAGTPFAGSPCVVTRADRLAPAPASPVDLGATPTTSLSSRAVGTSA
jgi:hypothetical protein